MMKDKHDHNVKITIKTPMQFFASGFGSGCAPVAPGTFGTVASIPIWMLLSLLSPISYAIAVIAIFFLGWYVSEKASQELGVHDHGGIVIDEFVGFFITMFLVPFSWINILLGFILFRIFDVIKPWPIKIIDQKVKGGFGIMIDDVFAGIMALICLHIILWGIGYLF